MNVIPEQRKAVVSYPNAFKMAPKEVKVQCKNDVRTRYDSEVSQFIHNVLREWVMSRHQVYMHSNTLRFSRRLAVDKILLMLIQNKKSDLPTLCEAIVSHGVWFVKLFPHKDSRYYHYFKEVVSQVLLWCDWYCQNHEEFNRNLFKN